MDNKDFGLIYEIEVTKENVSNLLSREIVKLMQAYGSRIKDELAGIALGPSSFKCFEMFCREQCTFTTQQGRNGLEFMGVPIYCGVLPFVVPLFKSSGWYAAHLEAKRFSSLTGGVDA